MNPAPNLSKSQRLQAEQEMNLSTVILQQIQLQRTLWAAVRAVGGRVTINSEAVDPLWDLKFERPDKTNPNMVVISASRLPDPTDEQLNKLAILLLGTDQHPQKAQEAVGLPEHPAAYCAARIAHLAVFHRGKWISRADFNTLPADQKPPAPETHPENGQ